MVTGVSDLNQNRSLRRKPDQERGWRQHAALNNGYVIGAEDLDFSEMLLNGGTYAGKRMLSEGQFVKCPAISSPRPYVNKRSRNSRNSVLDECVTVRFIRSERLSGKYIR